MRLRRRLRYSDKKCLVTSSAIIPNPWVRILDALEKKINRHSYDTWLKPTRYSHASNGVLFVRVPTAEFRHVGDKYADLIQEAVDNLGLGYEDVKFVTAEDDPSNTPIRHNGGLSALVRVVQRRRQCRSHPAQGAVRLGQRRATESRATRLTPS